MASIAATKSQWQAGAQSALSKLKADGIVTSQSPSHDKFDLFLSLLRGRADVNAHGYRQKVGGIVYAPACKNEWRRGVCPRAAGSKVSCTDCSARSFLPLDYKTLTNHFRGADERLIGEKVSDLTYDRRAGEGRDEWRTTGSSRGHTTS